MHSVTVSTLTQYCQCHAPPAALLFCLRKFLPMLTFLVDASIAAAVLYNVHQSFRLKDKASRKFFKHYFMVIASLLAVDNALSFIFTRIPYYQFFRLFLMGWLSIPGGTGPHFIYNVYIRNIHQLFEGDIDSVINNFKQYYTDLKNKYSEVVSKTKKGGEISIGFQNSEGAKKKLEVDVESSEAEPSSAAGNEDDRLADNLKTE